MPTPMNPLAFHSGAVRWASSLKKLRASSGRPDFTRVKPL